MVTVTCRSRRGSWLTVVAGAAVLMATTTVGAAADATTSPVAAQVDALWNQPQGIRADSAFYIVQSWWDGLTRVAQHDPQQRGLAELAQANDDLLNAYTLVQEQRTDPGPHPVAVIDPLLSGAYGAVTGVHVTAPVGSLFGWLNQAVVHLEGRGSTDTIVESLLRDARTQEALARRDLGSTSNGGGILLNANAVRQTALLARISGASPPAAGPASIPAAAIAPTRGSGNDRKGGNNAGQKHTPGQNDGQHGNAARETSDKH